MRVTHFTDAMGTGGELFGKERVIRLLMRAQRDAGLDARLITFAPSPLGKLMRADGFDVVELEDAHRRLPTRAIGPLRAALAAAPPDALHTHGYKANIIARAARLLRARIKRHVATCHGWFPEVEKYNKLDRATARFSELVTVTDPGMLAKFPKGTNAVYVANGIPDAPAADTAMRDEARRALGFEGTFVVGTLCRATETKGVLDVLECARRTQGEPMIWALAGGGPLADRLRAEAPPNARYLGHLDDPSGYRAALDVYLQASYIEGLSLSLLENMRDARAIVATDVAATSLVIDDGVDGTLIRPGDIEGTIAAVRRMRDEPGFAARAAANARARFEREFLIERQHEAFLRSYSGEPV
jgi:glycosyltransferase involved in cell wall biosynthesis